MDLIEALKQKRKEMADREGKEEYMIFPYPTLEETVRVAPETKEDLLKIKGWGPKRVQMFGDEILATLASAPEKLEEVIPPDIGSQDSGVFSVSQFIGKVNQILRTLNTVKVQGELSDIGIRGNMAFFDLKDSSGKAGVAKCFIGSWNFKNVNDFLEEGLEVIVQGTPTIYDKYGTFRITVTSIEPVGEGALKKAFDALKKRLEEKGYFDPSRKRPIPEFVENIGLITSEKGEAVNDFRKNIGNYGFKIHLIDVRVEGEQAESSITKAIKTLNTSHPSLDVIVLIRGGGGLENLKAFNSESIAEAVLQSRIPIITGIGHERDESIVDYTADYRCSTPTGVAVFLRTSRENLITRVNACGEALVIAVSRAQENLKTQIANASERLVFTFDKSLSHHKAGVANLSQRLEVGLRRILEKFKDLENLLSKQIYIYERRTQEVIHRLGIAKEKLIQGIETKKDKLTHRLETLTETLASLNPRAVLARGYSVTYDSEGKAVQNAKDIKIGSEIFIKLHKGKLGANVTKKKVA